MKKIYLNQGKWTIVDDEDFEWLNQWKWTYKHVKTLSCGEDYGIVVRNNYSSNGKRTNIIRMHRVILNAPPNFQVDHINGNRLDNRRRNIRLATIGQNNKNKRSVAKSGYKNVYREECINLRWFSKIMVDRKTIHLGCYDSKEEAAIAYNNAAIKYHGQFACLNKI